MLIDCPYMTQYRNSCGLGKFIVAYGRMKPSLSSVKLFALYLNDSYPEHMKKKAYDLFHMRLGWHKLMKINF